MTCRQVERGQEVDRVLFKARGDAAAMLHFVDQHDVRVLLETLKILRAGFAATGSGGGGSGKIGDCGRLGVKNRKAEILAWVQSAHWRILPVQ